MSIKNKYIVESIPKDHTEEIEDLVNSKWNGKESVKSLAALIKKSVKPVNNTALPPNYRRSVVQVLVKRALSKIDGDS